MRLNCRSVIALLLLSPIAAWAQTERVDIPGTPACITCIIEFVKVATIGARTDAERIGDPSHVTRGPRKTFVALPLDMRRLLIYDSAGVFLRSVELPQRSSGSTAGRFASPALGRGDSLMTRNGASISIFSPDFEFVREMPDSRCGTPCAGFALPNLPLSSPPGLVPLANGKLIITVAPTRDAIIGGGQLRLIDSTGNQAGLFGLYPGLDTLCISCSRRGIAALSHTGPVFVVHNNQYVIEQYDVSGNPQRIVTVSNSEWMQNWYRDSTLNVLTDKPRPSVSIATAADRGRMWVIGYTASSVWQAPGPPTGSGGGAVGIGGTQSFAIRAGSEASIRMNEITSRNVSTVVDLVDVDQRRLVASRIFDAERYTHVIDDLFARRKMEADGFISFDVFRLTIRER